MSFSEDELSSESFNEVSPHRDEKSKFAGMNATGTKPEEVKQARDEKNAKSVEVKAACAGLCSTIKRAYLLAKAGKLRLDASVTTSQCDEWTFKVLELEGVLGDDEAEDMMDRIKIIELSLDGGMMKKDELSTPAAICVTRTSTISAVISKLEKYNIGPWLMSLKSDLADMGVLGAITSPLHVDDPMNIKACARIYASVPGECRKPIRGIDIAYNMVSELRKEYEKPSYLQRRAIEQELREMKLRNYDAGSVDKHIDLLEEKLHHLISCGVPMDDKMKCSFLAQTLPIDRNGSANDWLNVYESMMFNSIKFEAAVLNVKSKAKWLVSSGVTNFEKKATVFLARGGRGSNYSCGGNYSHNSYNNRQGNRRGGNSVRKCFLCDGDHVLSECPHKMNFCKSLADDGATSEQYQKRTFFTSEPHFLDSGATSHHQRNARCFRTLKKASSTVITANGGQCKVEGVGEVIINTKDGPLKLKGVNYTPEFDSDLLSVAKLTDEGLWVLFKQYEALIIDATTFEVLLTAPRVGNLYRLDDAVEVAMRASRKDWHAAFGHPCEKKLNKRQERFPQLRMSHPVFCESCVLAKQRQQPYLLRADQSVEPLELLHLDLLDAKGLGFDGSRYALVIVDDFSKYCEVVLLKNKTAASVLAGFEPVKIRLEKSTGKSVKKVRTDNGLEFQGEFDQWLKSIGINHQQTVAYCHQSNGTVERANQTMRTKAAVLLQHSGMDHRFWPLSMKAAVFLYNLLPHSTNDEESPFKVFFPNALDFLERGGVLHVFGAAAYKWINPERRNVEGRGKFDPTSRKMVFVGYDCMDNDQLLLLAPDGRTVIRERNVKVVDDIFPFKEKKNQVEENQVKENQVGEDQVDESQIEEDQVGENQVGEDQVEETQVEPRRYNLRDRSTLQRPDYLNCARVAVEEALKQGGDGVVVPQGYERP